ncbi:hypothetical protein HPB50_022126 [Hyalomma asiaticum]|uniref:Uncharacterized protein n=1 Tax=Hyalomma asiaticum TaxID=266040 RepID=A0ACB7TP50_HYAAI|nr:hypothetical protein HPB50_022126 [Hyalomma asiaticum]
MALGASCRYFAIWVSHVLRARVSVRRGPRAGRPRRHEGHLRRRALPVTPTVTGHELAAAADQPAPRFQRKRSARLHHASPDLASRRQRRPAPASSLLARRSSQGVEGGVDETRLLVPGAAVRDVVGTRQVKALPGQVVSTSCERERSSHSGELRGADACLGVFAEAGGEDAGPVLEDDASSTALRS